MHCFPCTSPNHKPPNGQERSLYPVGWLSNLGIFWCAVQVTSLGVQVLPWTKNRTIPEIRGEKNAVPHAISCSITRDQRMAKVADDLAPTLIACDQAWYHKIEQCSLHEFRDGSFFFFFFFVQGSTINRHIDIEQIFFNGSRHLTNSVSFCCCYSGNRKMLQVSRTEYNIDGHAYHRNRLGNKWPVKPSKSEVLLKWQTPSKYQGAASTCGNRTATLQRNLRGYRKTCMQASQPRWEQHQWRGLPQLSSMPQVKSWQ